MSPMVPTNPLKLDRSHNVRTARRSNAAVCGFLPVLFYLLCSVWFHFSLFFKILFVEILNQNSKEKKKTKSMPVDIVFHLAAQPVVSEKLCPGSRD